MIWPFEIGMICRVKNITGLVTEAKYSPRLHTPPKSSLSEAAFQYIACTVFHYIGVGFAFVVPCTHVKHMLLFCNIDVHRILELEMCIDPLLGGYLNFSGLHGLLDTTWGYGCFLSVWPVLCFVWPYIFLVVMRALLQLRAQGFFFVPKHSLYQNTSLLGVQFVNGLLRCYKAQPFAAVEFQLESESK